MSWIDDVLGRLEGQTLRQELDDLESFVIAAARHMTVDKQLDPDEAVIAVADVIQQVHRQGHINDTGREFAELYLDRWYERAVE